VLKITTEQVDAPHARQELAPDLGRSIHPVHGQGQGGLHRIEYMLDQAINWVVWSAEHTNMPSGVNQLLNQNVPVRVQVVHRDAVPIIWCSWTKIQQDADDEESKFIDRRPSIPPSINPAACWIAWSVVLSADGTQNVQLLAVSVGTDLANPPCQMSFAPTAIGGLNEQSSLINVDNTSSWDIRNAERSRHVPVVEPQLSVDGKESLSRS